MKINWNRIKRTAIQSAAGAGVALITALLADFSKKAIMLAIITAVTTVVSAVLMNIQKQLEESEGDEK